MTIDFNVLHSRLKDEWKHLTEELEALRSSARSVNERREGSPFGKREEEATEALELEKRLALEQEIQDRLTKVERALRKFEEGTYGQCDSCGQSIDPDRLEALPHAALCLSCKAKQAKNAKGK